MVGHVVHPFVEPSLAQISVAAFGNHPGDLHQRVVGDVADEQMGAPDAETSPLVSEPAGGRRDLEPHDVHRKLFALDFEWGLAAHDRGAPVAADDEIRPDLALTLLGGKDLYRKGDEDRPVASFH